MWNFLFSPWGFVIIGMAVIIVWALLNKDSLPFKMKETNLSSVWMILVGLAGTAYDFLAQNMDKIPPEYAFYGLAIMGVMYLIARNINKPPEA